MKRLILIAALTSSTALAAQLSPQQQAWLDATLIHLYGSVSNAPDDDRQRFTELLLENKIQRPNPLGVDDPMEPNMSPQSCNALAAAVRAKANECSDHWEALENCRTHLPSGMDPLTGCAGPRDLYNACQNDLAALADDYQLYCGS